MKNLKKKSMIWFMTLVMVIGSVLSMAVPTRVEAAKMSFPKQIILTYPVVNSNTSREIKNFPVNGKVVKLKSNNKKVVTVDESILGGLHGEKEIYFTPKKVGKTTVTFQVKNGKKVQKFTTKVIVKKYSNPIKSFKIGKTQYASKFKRTNFIEPKKGATGKLSIKLKSGWKIKSIRHHRAKDCRDVKVKNNKKMRLRDGDSLIVTVYNKKQNLEYEMIIYCHSSDYGEENC